MNTTITVNVSIHINATVPVVWNALTDPKQIKKYLFGTTTKSDWKVGSPITFSGEWQGKPYEDKGTILQMEKERILQYNYWSSMSGEKDEPDNYQVITYSLSQEDGNTRLTITQNNCRSEEARDHSEQNWQMVINTIKGMLEK
ncbi:MAG: SRPBCC domain-containing protein [Bacteroidota bacterium]